MLLLHNAKHCFPKSLVFSLFQTCITGIYTHRHTHIYYVMCYAFSDTIYKYCRGKCAYVTGYTVFLSILFKAWKCLSVFLYQ